MGQRGGCGGPVHRPTQLWPLCSFTHRIPPWTLSTRTTWSSPDLWVSPPGHPSPRLEVLTPKLTQTSLCETRLVRDAPWKSGSTEWMWRAKQHHQERVKERDECVSEMESEWEGESGTQRVKRLVTAPPAPLARARRGNVVLSLRHCYKLGGGDRRWCMIPLYSRIASWEAPPSHTLKQSPSAAPTRRASRLSHSLPVEGNREMTSHAGMKFHRSLKKNQCKWTDTKKRSRNSDVFCSREQTGYVCVTPGVKMLLSFLSRILIEWKKIWWWNANEPRKWNVKKMTFKKTLNKSFKAWRLSCFFRGGFFVCFFILMFLFVLFVYDA